MDFLHSPRFAININTVLSAVGLITSASILSVVLVEQLSLYDKALDLVYRYYNNSSSNVTINTVLIVLL